MRTERYPASNISRPGCPSNERHIVFHIYISSNGAHLLPCHNSLHHCYPSTHYPSMGDHHARFLSKCSSLQLARTDHDHLHTPLAATRTLVFTNNMRSGTSVAPNLKSRTFPGGRKEQWPHYTLVVNITPLTSHPVYGSVICLC